MATTLVLTIQSEETEDVIQDLLQAPLTDPKLIALKSAEFIRKMAAGHRRGQMRVQVSAAAPVRATATAALVSVLATQTITIAGTVLTASSTPVGEAQFEIDGNDAADAAALVACINAHTVLSKLVSAVVTTGSTITMTALVPGVIGNIISLAKSDTTITISGALFAGGTGGADEAGVLVALGL